MALRTSADNAEDVAAGFQMYREPLPEHAAAITGLIAHLYAISSSLKSLDDSMKDRALKHNLSKIEYDLSLILHSLKSTLEDIVNFFGAIDKSRGPTREAYERSWTEMCAYFRKEAHYTLSTRLENYNIFSARLCDIVRDKNSATAQTAKLRNDIKLLLAKQDESLPPRLAATYLRGQDPLSNMSVDPRSHLGGRRPGNRRSYERIRPNPQSPRSPSSTSTAAFSSDVPPSTASAPASPLTEFTTTSQSVEPNDLVDHWARNVFNTDSRAATRIPFVGESSRCYGKPNPGARRWLHEQAFEELLQLVFHGELELHVYFYVREEDHRARILCKSPHPSRASDYFCMPLNLLEILRSGSCLQLCRRRRSASELVLWANFKFNTIERMVLFFCTFLALRSQDSGRPVEDIQDYELENEEELFGGQIVDDGYLHALRVYRDNVSGAVRLQASVHRGEMKRAPIWTAFITQHLKSRGWIRRANSNSKIVLLSELHRSIFTSSEYAPPRTSHGEQILKFTTRTDVDSFFEVIKELTAKS